jgi:hypothetical protein
MTTINEGITTQAAPADTPQPATPLTPEAVVELLRSVRAQIGDLAPMTSAQRKALRNRARTKNPVLQASINALGASDKVSEAVGQAAGEVRQKHDEANRWTAVEDELRSLLSGVGRREPHPSPGGRVPRCAGGEYQRAAGAQSRQRQPRAACAGDQTIEEFPEPQEGGAGSRYASVSGKRAFGAGGPWDVEQ